VTPGVSLARAVSIAALFLTSACSDEALPDHVFLSSPVIPSDGAETCDEVCASMDAACIDRVWDLPDGNACSRAAIYPPRYAYPGACVWASYDRADGTDSDGEGVFCGTMCGSDVFDVLSQQASWMAKASVRCCCGD